VVRIGQPLAQEELRGAGIQDAEQAPVVPKAMIIQSTVMLRERERESALQLGLHGSWVVYDEIHSRVLVFKSRLGG